MEISFETFFKKIISNISDSGAGDLGELGFLWGIIIFGAVCIFFYMKINNDSKAELERLRKQYLLDEIKEKKERERREKESLERERELEENEEDGQRTYTFPDGTKYEGEWKDGKFHGQGKVTLADGKKYEGRFKDGVFLKGEAEEEEEEEEEEKEKEEILILGNSFRSVKIQKSSKN